LVERGSASLERPGGQAVRHYGNRFGRSEEARTAVMEAVDDLLLERGFAALTIEAVAARAGVGKQTIYRWWSSKSDLLFDAYLDEMREELIPVELGSLKDYLRYQLGQSIAFFSKAGNTAMFRALAGQAQHDEAVATRFRNEIVKKHFERDCRPFEKARLRGDLPIGLDIEQAVEELTAPLFYRLLVTGRPYEAADAERLIDTLLDRYRKTGT
jgi:AcrR family transcriptional regulator